MTPQLTDSPDTSPQSNKLFKTANDFSYYIESQAVSRREECYTVLIEYCEMNGVDYEKLSPMISEQLKNKLAIEFADMGMLPKTSTIFGD